MQMVIDIPEDIMADLYNAKPLSEEQVTILLHVITKGYILSDHGELIDRKKVLNRLSSNIFHSYEEYLEARRYIEDVPKVLGAYLTDINVGNIEEK